MGKKSREKHLRRRREDKEKDNISESRINLSCQLEKICFFIVKWGIYLSLFAPLVLSKNYFFPFVVPKTIFFRIIVNIIFIAYILLATANPKFRPKINFLTVFIAVFLCVLFLTSIFGVNFSRSFWSVFERMEGLLTFFHLFAFYIVLTGFLKEKKDWQNVLSVSILVALLISLNVLFSTSPTARGGGTIGNSSFFSAYVLFNLFFAFILFFWSKKIWRIFYGLSLIVFLASLFFNPMGFTKGVVFSLGIGMVLLIAGFMFFSKIKLLKIAMPFVLILMILIGSFIIKNFYFQEREFNLREIPDRSRQIIWSIAWQGWQERFLLGWGLENFNVSFIKYYDPELPTTGDVWYDRAHNIVLDLGITSGIVGLLSYLSIFGAAIFGLARNLFKKTENEKPIIFLAMITLLFVYFLQNFWVFDMISSYIMFFLSLAFIGFLISRAPENGEQETKERIISIPPFIGSFLIILTIFALIFGNILPDQASRFTIKGIVYPLEESIIAFEKAFKISPITKFEIPEQFSSRIISLSAQENQNKELIKQGFDLAEKRFKEAIEKNALDFRLYLFLGRHYNYFYQFSGIEEKLALAEESLEKALELGSTNQQVYFIFAQTRFLQNKEQEAIGFLQKAKELNPSFSDASWYLLRSYNAIGEYELSLLELKELDKSGFNWQEETETLKEGIKVLKETGEDINILIPLYEKGVELSPKDLYLWEDLINAYINTGQLKKAKAGAERFLELNPEFGAQVEELLKQLEGLTENL